MSNLESNERHRLMNFQWEFIRSIKINSHFVNSLKCISSSIVIRHARKTILNLNSQRVPIDLIFPDFMVVRKTKRISENWKASVYCGTADEWQCFLVMNGGAQWLKEQLSYSNIDTVLIWDRFQYSSSSWLFGLA